MKNKKGFTLVELLVVIAIIGLLSTIAFISLNRARAKARDAKRISDVRQLQSALELYYNDQSNPSYPVGSGTVITSAQLPAQYVSAIPQAPTPADDPVSGPDCQSTNQYDYTSFASDTLGVCGGSTACGWYEIRFCIGGATGGVVAGTHFATPSGIR